MVAGGVDHLDFARPAAPAELRVAVHRRGVGFGAERDLAAIRRRLVAGDRLDVLAKDLEDERS